MFSYFFSLLHFFFSFFFLKRRVEFLSRFVIWQPRVASLVHDEEQRLMTYTYKALGNEQHTTCNVAKMPRKLNPKGFRLSQQSHPELSENNRLSKLTRQMALEDHLTDSRRLLLSGLCVNPHSLVKYSLLNKDRKSIAETKRVIVRIQWRFASTSSANSFLKS